MSDAEAKFTAELAARLGDEYAAQLRICEQVLRLEQDLDVRRRVAEKRFIELKSRRAA